MSVTNGQGSPQFPTAESAMPASTPDDLEAALATLAANKDHWVATDIPARIALLEQIAKDMESVAERWVSASIAAKGHSAGHPAEGDEWSALAIVMRLLRLLKQSLQDIEKHGRPQLPKEPYIRPDGQVVAPVYPQKLADRLVFMETTAEVWMQPGVTIDEMYNTQARIYQDKSHAGKVCLILGAGNYSALPPDDLLSKLFQEDQVVILKMNPVNDYLGPLLEEGFRALIERGFLRVVYGGPDVAQYLIHHDLVDSLHMTGSDKTFEAIVFGAGEEGQQRKAARQPIVTKPFTAELGNITPIIIVPGPWTPSDIAYQARALATMLVVNTGYNCVTARVILQYKHWPRRDALNDTIAAVLSTIPARKAYYPGSEARHTAFLNEHPDADLYGGGGEGVLPWTYIRNVSPENTADIAFQQEAFCSLMTETALDASNTADYVDQAVDFVNNNIWGTLSVTLIVHPESMKDPAIRAAVERAVANLRYGSVGVNVWGASAIFLGITTWGGYAGSDIYDIQSGTGVIGNTLMFEKPQKSVIWGPFRRRPDPTQVTSPQFPAFMRKFALYEADPKPSKFVSLLATALKS